MFFRCYFIRKKLVDYDEGNLTPSQKKSIENHVSHCPNCTGYAYQYRKTRELIAELDDQYRPPDEYWSTVIERLKQKLFSKISG